MLTETAKPKNVTLERCGLHVSMLRHVSTECPTASLGKVKANDIQLNRKVLADLAMNHPEAFKAVVDKIK